MSEHYDFHYQPTGSGAISGQQVLEQTEDAINELGDYVNDNVGGAMDVAQQALETAQNAEQDAQTALDTANSFSSAIQSAQQDASTALSTASNANNTAIQAQQDASSAVTTANNASGQVSTLSGTVTALGQRVTTAEGNITTLQNDVSIAQGNASSAMATAGTMKQQAFVFRYSSTTLVASSTNSNALLDNTDNLKVGDKVIDSSGVLFSITAIDTANSTFTIGTALIDLAIDSSVMHLSGNETASGNKDFSDDVSVKILTATGKYISDEGSTNRRTVLKLLAGARDTDGYSCSYVTRLRTNKAQGALISSDVQTLGFDFVENQVRTLNTFIIRATNWLNDVPQKIELISNIPDYTYGNSLNKAKINDLNPGSLSMPDLSNGIDISSYLSVGSSTNDSYTAPANGYIGVIYASSSACGCYVYNYTDGVFMRSSSITDSTYTNVCGCFIPILKNQTLNISTRATQSIVSAKFFPCLGNV